MLEEERDNAMAEERRQAAQQSRQQQEALRAQQEQQRKQQEAQKATLQQQQDAACRAGLQADRTESWGQQTIGKYEGIQPVAPKWRFFSSGGSK